MDKFIFFQDEVVKIKMVVDNRQSQRRIRNINCILRQRVRINKNRENQNLGQFWEKYYDLHRIQINKAKFAEALQGNNTSSSKKLEGKRVYGQFLMEFDLKKIFDRIKKLRGIGDESERNELIKSGAISRVSMSGVNEQTQRIADM